MSLSPWQRLARARAKRWGVPCEDVDRAAVLARGGGVCWMCKAPVTMETMQVDHIIPISRGGPHVAGNLACACGPCNARKSDGITALPASDLARAVFYTGAIARRLARIGVHAAPLYPMPDCFGPATIGLKFWPAPGAVNALLRAAPEIEAVLGECRAGTPSIRFDAPYLCVTVPRMHPRAVALADMRSRGLRVQVGVTCANRAAIVDLAQSPHVVIGGATGGGKSVLLQTLAYGLACGGARLALADGDASTFDGMRDWAALQYAVADTSRDAIALACEVQAEIDRRRAGWTEPLVLIVDEAQLIAADRRGKAALADIAARGRKWGVRLILATQHIRADRLDTVVTGQCGWRIALRLETEVAARLIGCEGATRLAGRGDALISHAGQTMRVQVAMGSAADWARMPLAGGAVAAASGPVAVDAAGDIIEWAKRNGRRGPVASVEDIKAEAARRGIRKGTRWGMEVRDAAMAATG